MKILKNIFEIILDIIMAIVILLIAIAIFYIIQTKVQKKSFANIMGYTVLEVITGSMANTINVEDFIIVKIGDTIYENDIIVYQDGEDLITHRLIKIDGDKLIPKGDANNSKDVPINYSKSRNMETSANRTVSLNITFIIYNYNNRDYILQAII